MDEKVKKEEEKDFRTNCVKIFAFVPEDLSIVWPVSGLRFHSLSGTAASLSTLPASLAQPALPSWMILCKDGQEKFLWLFNSIGKI